MGVEPFLVASTVEGVMAQRLVRTICPECKVEYEPDHARAADRLPGRRRNEPRADAVEGRRLPGVPPDRLPRPDRHLRADGDQRHDPRAWSCSASTPA